MKKYAIWALLFSPFAFATAQQELSTRLGKINAFTADFTQIVTDPDNRIISKGDGEVAIKRPNLFNWHSITPDENLLISDGRTLWHYSPFLQQVTAMWMEDATAQTPFVLLTRNSAKDWQDYKVSQQGNSFSLTPKVSSNMQKFIVDVQPDGRITRFSVVELDGQTSRFNFEDTKVITPSSSLFAFTVPSGVELDDQRR